MILYKLLVSTYKQFHGQLFKDNFLLIPTMTDYLASDERVAMQITKHCHSINGGVRDKNESGEGVVLQTGFKNAGSDMSNHDVSICPLLI